MRRGRGAGLIRVRQVPATMAKLLERMFGSRSVSLDAAVLIVAEVRAAAATALRETATASLIRVGSDPGDEALHAARQRCAEMAANLLATADGLPGITEPFRVVLMGRTQAGKSTLYNFLTGGQHSVVGSGGQRTTRDAISVPLAGRPDILIVDTPGVGALDGAEDREVALAEARTADLVVWVGADGALQEETAVALEQAADWGVPLVLVWNCRAILDTPGGLADFLQYPEDTFVGLEGHARRARMFLDRFGQRPRAALALHAGAALASLADNPESGALLQTSRGEQLVSVIESEADRRLHNRVVAVADVARRALVDSQRTAHRLATELLATEDTRLRSSKDFTKRAEATMRDAERRFRSGLDGIFDQLRGWEDRHYKRNEKDLQAEWAKTEEQVRAGIDQHFIQTGEGLRQNLASVADDVAAGWEARFDQLQARHRPGTKGWGSPWVDNAIRYAICGTAAAVVSAASIVLPPGADHVAMKLVHLAEAGLLKKLNFRKRRFQRRKTLQSQITAIRDEMLREAVVDWTNDCEPIRAALTQRQDDDNASAASARRAADSAHRLARQADCSISAVDGMLVRALLRLGGCDRAADHVGRVVRRPGLAATVAFSDEATLDELLLWPMRTSREAIRPIPDAATTTPADRVAHALDLGRRGGVILPSHEGLEAVVADGSSVAFLNAEAVLVSATAGVPVTLRPQSHESDVTACPD